MNEFEVLTAYLPALTKSRIFKGMSEEEILKLFSLGIQIKIEKFKPGDSVFHMSEKADQTGLVLDGKITVEKILPNGQALSIAAKSAGDLIGEAAVFSKPHNYPCELYAKDEATLLFIDKDNLLKLLQASPKALENFLTELSSMTYALQSKVEMLTYSGIIPKISYFLLSEKERTGSNVIKVPGTITNMSQILNVSRTSLHREIKKLSNAGAVRIKSGSIEILDASILESFL